MKVLLTILTVISILFSNMQFLVYARCKNFVGQPSLPFSMIRMCNGLDVNGESLFLNTVSGILRVNKTTGIIMPGYQCSSVCKINNSGLYDIFYHEGIITSLPIVPLDRNHKLIIGKSTIFMAIDNIVVWETPYIGRIIEKVLLSSSRLLIIDSGYSRFRIFNVKNGLALLEKVAQINQTQFNKTSSFSPVSNKQFVSDGTTAVINRKYVVDIEAAKIIWELDKDGLPVIQKNSIVLINGSITTYQKATFYDKHNGKFMFEQKLDYIGGPPEGDPKWFAANNAVLGIVKDTAYGLRPEPLGLFGFDIYSKNIVFSRPYHGDLEMFDIIVDQESIYLQSPAGIEKIDPDSGKTIWRLQLPSQLNLSTNESVCYKTYPAWFGSQVVEELSYQHDGQWCKLIDVPFSSKVFNAQEKTSLFLTSKGVFWIPDSPDKSTKPSLISPDGPVKSFWLSGWENSKGCGYLFYDNKIYLNVTGQGLAMIDLESMSIKEMFPNMLKDDYNSIDWPVFVNEKWAVTGTSNGIMVFDNQLTEFKGEYKVDIDPKSILSKNHLVWQEGDYVNFVSVRNGIKHQEPGKFVGIIDDLIYLRYSNYASDLDEVFIFNPETGSRQVVFEVPKSQKRSKAEIIDDYLSIGGLIYPITSTESLQNISNGQEYMPIYSEASISTTYTNLRINKTAAFFKECPIFSINKLSEKEKQITFSFTNTRQDDLDLLLKGEAYLASWGDDGKPPIFTKLDEPHHKLGPLLPGMSQEITFDLPKPLEIDGKKSDGKYFALIVESNGLLDTKNSELSDFDKEGRPLFDGTPLSLDKQHALVLTVWKR